MQAPHASFAAAAFCALTCLTNAQGPAPGFRLFGTLYGTDTLLVDSNGAVVHTWPSTFAPGSSVYLEADGTLLRTIWTQPISGLAGVGGGIQRVALDGTVLWDWRYEGPGFISHHDIEPLPNGNVLMIAWEDKTLAETIAAGRDPALIRGEPFRPDHVIEVRQTGPTTGQIVWEWHVWDHLIQDFDSAQANHGVVADHPELIDVNYPPRAPFAGDWNHFNSIDYDPIHDWVILSPRSQNEIWVIDHSTTTAEAAGHTGGIWGKGGDLLYRWGNPAAYGRGLASDQVLFGQHGAVVIPPGYRGAGNFLVFNNQPSPGVSEVWEFIPPLDAAGRFRMSPNGRYGPAGPIWSYSAPGFNSPFVSNCERLPNGNTLICSGGQGWVFEVTPSGSVVWQYMTGGAVVFHAHYVDRTLWNDSRELSITSGGTVSFDLICGTASANQSYVLVGSVSGTSPGVLVETALLPLNFDGWFLQTVSAPNVYPLGNSAGFLDPDGRAVATFSLPGGILPPMAAGIHFDHAFATFDAVTGEVDFASNPVRFTLVP